MPHLKALLLGSTLALGLGAPGALAQGQAPAQAAPQASAAPVDEARFEKFVDAAVEVQEIQVEAQTRAQAAPNEQQGTEILVAANERAAEAVTGQGLSIDEYNTMMTQVQADPQLMARVERHVQEKSGPSR